MLLIDCKQAELRGPGPTYEKFGQPRSFAFVGCGRRCVRSGRSADDFPVTVPSHRDRRFRETNHQDPDWPQTRVAGCSGDPLNQNPDRTMVGQIFTQCEVSLARSRHPALRFADTVALRYLRNREHQQRAEDTRNHALQEHRHYSLSAAVHSDRSASTLQRTFRKRLSAFPS